MRFLQRSLMGLFILAVTLGLLGYGAILMRGAFEARAAKQVRVPQARERVFSVNALMVMPEQIAPVITAYGEVASRRTLEIRTSLGGVVTKMAENFVAGGRFSKGDFMLQIDEADAQAALRRAEADLLDAEAETRDAARALALAVDELANAESQVRLRENALERARNLKRRGVGSDAAVEVAEIAASAASASVLTRRQALASAEARVDSSATRKARAEIALEDAQRTLGETEIRARFDGVLTDVAAVEGRLVSPNERLADLLDPSDLEVSFRLSTQDYSRLLGENGLRAAKVRVLLDDFGVNLSAEGALSREEAAIASGETGRALFAEIGAAQGFKPGDFVTVEIEEAPLEGVARLPATAVGADGQVLVVGEENRLKLREVRVLRRQGDDVLIRGGQLAGLLVVSERTPLLGPGIAVKPLVADAPQEAQPSMISLTPERRARLVAAVKANGRMPGEVKARILSRLEEEEVPARMVERLESRMGG